MIFRENQELEMGLETTFQKRNEAQFALQKTISSHLAIPNLVGLWTMASADVANNGDCFDISGAGRTLTNNNTVQFGYDGLIPYAKFATSPSQSRLARIDEDGVSIIGNEAYVVTGQNGLSLGGWFYFDNDTPSATELLIGKWESANLSYVILRLTSGILRFSVSSDGSTFRSVFSSMSYGSGQWYKIDGRFSPSTELAIFANGQKSTETTSIPSAIFDSAAEFFIGGRSSGLSVDGYVSMAYLSANQLNDEAIQNLYHSGKPLYQG
jgi:hypothetical protein